MAGWQQASQKQQDYNPALYSMPVQTLKTKPSLAVTEIETDFEDDASEFDEDFYRGRRSEDSTSKRSETTLSSFDEVRTPNSNSIGFAFQNVAIQQQYDGAPTLRRSKAMEGPTGPSLFRMSQESGSEMEVVLTMSPPISPQDAYRQPPLQQQQQQQQQQQLEPQGHVFQEAPRTSVPLRTWTPWQVADWMHSLGMERTVIDQFFVNDISGLTLIDLQYDDLKELGIASFGQRHRLWNEIKALKDRTLASNMPPTPGPEMPWQQHPEPSPTLPMGMSREPTPPQQCSASSSNNNSSRGSPEIPEAVERQKKGRRAMRRAVNPGDVVLPAESASIVAIEQLLPEPHVCDKGEACSKWRKQQRRLKKIATEFPLEYSQIVEGRAAPAAGDDSSLLQPVSIALSSVVASSDVLGPAVPKVKLAEENLQGLQSRDPQENVRQFLTFQHVATPTKALPDTPPYELFPPLSPPDNQAPAHNNLRTLPRLTIPAGQEGGPRTNGDDLTARPIDRSKTPLTAYHQGGRAPVHDVYRVGSPASEMDVPVTALPVDPLGPNARDVSSSVPPDMRYGGPGDLVQQANPRPMQQYERGPPPVAYFNYSNKTLPPPPGTRRRSTSQTGMRPRRPSYGMSPLPEVRSPIGVALTTGVIAMPPEAVIGNRDTLATEIEDDVAAGGTPTTPPAQHSGQMRKRRTRMLRHEWNEAHYRLTGTRLTAHRDAYSLDTLDCIDVDDYAVAVAANQSKLNAAMRRLRLNGKDKGDDVWKFAFQLTPAADAKSNKASAAHSNNDSASGSGNSGGSHQRAASAAASSSHASFASSGVPKTHHFAVKNANERIDWMRELMLARAKKDKNAQHERFE